MYSHAFMQVNTVTCFQLNINTASRNSKRIFFEIYAMENYEYITARLQSIVEILNNVGNYFDVSNYFM